MYQSQSLFYLTTALHVSGGTHNPSSGAQTTASTASGICHTVTATCSYCGRVGTDRFQLFHDSNRQQYGVMVTRCCSYSCFVLLKMGDSDI